MNRYLILLKSTWLTLKTKWNFKWQRWCHFKLIGPHPALKNYDAWLFESDINVEEPNSANEVVARYYGVRPLWKTAYSQGIVVKAENDSDYFIFMECSNKNEGYKYTQVILSMGGCMWNSYAHGKVLSAAFSSSIDFL